MCSRPLFSPKVVAIVSRAINPRPFGPVDIAPLVYFRLVFAAIMLWDIWVYFNRGWIWSLYIAPKMHFSFYGFDWIRPWSGGGMYLHFYALAALALCILLGFWYRVSTTLFFVAFAYVFLLDEAYYRNHLYLVALLAFLLIFVPAHRSLSIDVLRRPEIRRDTAPAWALWILRAQVGIPYVYGGLAKLNGDWLRGEPMRRWLAERTSFPVVGSLFTEEWVVLLASYGSLLLDLLVVPLLLWPPTRVPALSAAVVFHLMNSRLFEIGIFPWLMIAGTMLFLPPQWLRLGGVGRQGEHRETKDVAVLGRLQAGHWIIIAVLAVFSPGKCWYPSATMSIRAMRAGPRKASDSRGA